MCSIAGEDAFGPTVAGNCRNGFDFTLLFEELFFTIAPCSVILLSLPLRVFRLLKQQPPQAPAGLSLYSKLFAHCVSTGVKISLLILIVVPGLNVPKTRATIATAALSAAASISLIGLSYLQHSRSPRPSTLLTLFLALSVALDAIRARTIWAVQPKLIFIIFVLGLASDLAKFLLECREVPRYPSDPPKVPPKESTANVFNRSLFWWLNPLLFRGFKNVLEVENLTSIDERVNSDTDGDTFARKWEGLTEKSPSALIWLLILHHRGAIFAAFLPRVCLTGFTFAQPFLLTRIVSFLTEQDGNLTYEYGTGLIVATMLIYLGLALTTAKNQHKTYRLITMMRGSLVPLIYRHTLRLDLGSVKDSAALTLMSVDIERITSGLRYVHEIWASPIDVALAIWLLKRQIGVAAVAPASIFILCSLVGLGVASTMGARQRRWLEAIQQRVQVTSEMLKNMKEIRMGGLQGPMAERLRSLRAREISESRPFKKALVMIVTLSFTTAASGPLLAFTMYTLLAIRDGTAVLNYEKAYTSLSILTLLQTPVALILDSLAGVLTAIGALQRIGEYLSKPARSALRVADSDGDQEKSITPPMLGPRFLDEKRKDLVVSIHDFSAGWDPNEPFVIKNITFDVMSSSINFVMGPVACGKSTLLLAVLGETIHNKGQLKTTVSRMSYCSQQPWISNDTICHNVLGNKPFVKPWYDQVIQTCALADDIRSFAHGDHEIVGNSGMTLSGGQKARLGLARAIYARENLLLLDDVFSGLDAKTEDRIFTALFGAKGLLVEEGTTVILATNAMHRRKYADNIVVLGPDGRLVEGDAAVAKEVMIASEKAESSTEEKRPTTATQQEGPRPPSIVETPQGSERRTGDRTVYSYYIKTVHLLNALFFASVCVTFVLGLSLPQFVLKWWLERGDAYSISHVARYLAIYGGLAGIAILSVVVAAWHLTAQMLPRASTRFHHALLETVLNAPLQFFSNSDVGTTINRFAQDLQLADMELPLALFNTTVELIMCIAQLIIIAIASKYIGIALPALLAVFYLVQKFYLRTARQLRLLDIEAKAPLFSRFLEVLSGLATIRAFGWEAEFEHRNRAVFDVSQKPSYLLFCVQRWLNLVLDLIVASIAVIVVSIGVRLKGQVDPGLLGVALVNIVQFSISIKSLLSNWTQLEISIGAVARIRAFAKDTVPADDHEHPLSDLVPSTWPIHGHIEFQNVTARYEGTSQPVIRGLNLVIQHGEKIALCGRSGSGKSSLVSALYRVLELSEGSITIDGINISTLPRDTLYTRLICVTQSPHLMTGTVRENIDPSGAVAEKRVEEVLKEVNLWETVQARGGIGVTLSDDLFSVGQKQLLCLARAMVRSGPILILDEVTASVDWETDQLMQTIIRRHFASQTVITIAHRISTILDADRVAVISAGEVVELGPPTDLLGREPASQFRGLYEASAGCS
ncbi:hypothetical protein FE257_005851 [Aspergillus nanangensis]|uniref:ABC multidrug transporter n=1 Tax=Aspergillus nanangensis TaxID=2582783 RepID=A0AAD4CPT8_ASPNN|nr:hypothetical protein FE257_005851 [Aspergillus nanangensis]